MSVQSSQRLKEIRKHALLCCLAIAYDSQGPRGSRCRSWVTRGSPWSLILKRILKTAFSFTWGLFGCSQHHPWPPQDEMVVGREDTKKRKALKDRRRIFQLSLWSPPPYLYGCFLQGGGWKRSGRLPCRNHGLMVTSRNVFKSSLLHWGSRTSSIESPRNLWEMHDPQTPPRPADQNWHGREPPTMWSVDSKIWGALLWAKESLVFQAVYVSEKSYFGNKKFSSKDFLKIFLKKYPLACFTSYHLTSNINIFYVCAQKYIYEYKSYHLDH